MTKTTPQKTNHRLMLCQSMASYLFLLPFLLFFVIFVVYPMVMCVYTSFFDAQMGKEDVFIGFGNYIELWKDKEFLTALWNTVVIVAVSVPVTCAFSLWVASVISKMHIAATSALRCVFYLPVVTGSVAVTMVWKWIYDYYNGILNYIGTSTGLLEENIKWLGDSNYALGCIIMILLTTSVGQPIVLYVSALDNVDKSLVEAAEVDGATPTQAFWRIKWPQMLPTTLYILVITSINSFQCFALIQLLTNGGSNTKTLMFHIYYTCFKEYRYGYASSMGVILAIIIAIFSAVQFKLGQEK